MELLFIQMTNLNELINSCNCVVNSEIPYSVYHKVIYAISTRNINI